MGIESQAPIAGGIGMGNPLLTPPQGQEGDEGIEDQAPADDMVLSFGGDMSDKNENTVKEESDRFKYNNRKRKYDPEENDENWEGDYDDAQSDEDPDSALERRRAHASRYSRRK